MAHRPEAFVIPSGGGETIAGPAGGASTIKARTETFVLVPRGTAHCFQNQEDRPLRLPVMFTPSGMERFFEEHALLPSGAVDPEQYRAIAERSSTQVAGPTLAESHPLS